MRDSALIVLVALLVGCSQVPPERHGVKPHSRLWTEQPAHNVWTYQQVVAWKTEDGGALDVGHISRQLLPGEAAVLQSGTVVSHDGMRVRIDGNAIPTEVRNMVVRDDGTVHENAFIRTFE